MLYIGFDLGTNCGMAEVGIVGLVCSGANAFPPPTRYKKMRDHIIMALGQHHADDIHIAYEMPHARGRYATRVLIGMECMLIDVCEELGLEPPRDVHSGTLKKYFTGNGRATKQDMMAEASRRVGREITDDNEADAIAVAMWLRDELGGA